MKKTMLAILMLIISCAATNLSVEAATYIRNNKFYSSKPYYYTSWSILQDQLRYRFIHTTEDNKTYFRLKQRIDGRASIGSEDYIIVVFFDGREYRLDYCTEPVYKGYIKKGDTVDNYSEVEAMGEIDNVTSIDKIIIVQNGYCYIENIVIRSSMRGFAASEYIELMQNIEKLKEEKNE